MLGTEMVNHAKKIEALAKKQQAKKNAAKEKREQGKKVTQQAQTERADASQKKENDKLQWELAHTCSTGCKIFQINHRFCTCELCGVYKACILCQDDANIAKVHTAACFKEADELSSHESNAS
jgi:hypothetical protein